MLLIAVSLAMFVYAYVSRRIGESMTLLRRPRAGTAVVRGGLSIVIARGRTTFLVRVRGIRGFRRLEKQERKKENDSDHSEHSTFP